jgi:hypothetical protein
MSAGNRENGPSGCDVEGSPVGGRLAYINAIDSYGKKTFGGDENTKIDWGCQQVSV